MKKKSQKKIIRSKRSKPKVAVKSKEMKMSRKKSEHEIRKQLASCEDFIKLVEDTLKTYARHLDDKTTPMSAETHAEMVSILDTIHTDIEAFAEELLPYQTNFDDFVAAEHLDVWDVSATMISLCTSIDLLRGRYTHLFFLNQQSLLDLVANDDVVATEEAKETV